MASVRFEHVTKRFDGVAVVKDLSLNIDDREFLVLVGSSGCGKSTTLRMLAGLEEVSEGEVHIGERRVTNDPPRHRDIAMVFQSYALYPHMTAYGNLAFSLKNRGLPRDEIERRVRAAAEVLDIVQLLDRRPRKLSGGERQRVALGRAIVREPQVFLMDEPLSNLDAQLRVSTRAELVKLHQRLQTTFVYVTHDQVEAMTMGTRIAVLREGVLVQVDTAEGLYERPTNLFVASFIGSPPMNFIPATVRTDGGAIRVETAALTLDLGHDAGQLLRPVTKGVLGVRPEDIELVGEASAPGRAVVSAEVSYVEPMGGEALLGLIIGGQEVVARVREHRGARAGEQVTVGFYTKRVYLYDHESKALALAPQSGAAGPAL